MPDETQGSAKVTRQEPEAFRARWQAVEAITLAEQRSASIAMRWQQLNAIYQLGEALGLLAGLAADRQEEVVRQRWCRLKSIIA
ncbi:MAG: hypothetical protein AB1791_10695 [Chloroflexota bacterium]